MLLVFNPKDGDNDTFNIILLWCGVVWCGVVCCRQERFLLSWLSHFNKPIKTIDFVSQNVFLSIRKSKIEPLCAKIWTTY